MSAASLHRFGDATTDDQKLAYLRGRLSEMGVDASRRIMMNAVALSLDGYQVQILVEECCAHVRAELVAADVHAMLVDDIMLAFELAVVREGKRIATGLSEEGGTA